MPRKVTLEKLNSIACTNQTNNRPAQSNVNFKLNEIIRFPNRDMSIMVLFKRLRVSNGLKWKKQPEIIKVVCWSRM